MINATNISHRFGDLQVLTNVSVTLAPGERIAIMGPSGCGKTTLLKIVLGLLKPTEGTITNSFVNPAVVFQEPRLLPWRTAMENVELVLRDKKSSHARAIAALEQMELDDAADKYPKELSGGMQQRVAIARALAAGADLLILDEPFKGLDEALRTRVLQTVTKTNAAVLLVTHDEWEANALNCRIWTL